MSKLLDRLDKISQGTVKTLGFGAAGRSEKVPSMAILGKIDNSSKSEKAASSLAGIDADGAIIEGMTVEEVLTKVAPALDKVPWGLRLQELKGDLASSYRERGCDFLAFGAGNALVGALGDEETGYLLCIAEDMEERYLPAIEDLPVNAVMMALDTAKQPLTLEHLLTIGAIRGAFSKYFLLEVSGAPDSGELEGLRDIGVDGLVVDAGSLSAKDLQALKERVLALPRKQISKSDKASAVLPRWAYAGVSRAPQEEPDDDDDEE